VSDLGSVQGIQGPLYLSDPPSYNTLNIDDSADAAARTVTLSTSAPGGVPWGEVAGLSPAPIYYKYADTSSMNLTTSPANVQVNVQATGVPTYIRTYATGPFSGADVVNIGNAGSLQGILGALYVCNQPGFTAINIDNYADTTQHDATLSSFSNGPDPGPWGSITGLAPASIDFAWNDIYDSIVEIWDNPADVSWTVNPDALETVVGVVVYQNGNQIN
jgi:hypothetical protein